MYTLADYVSDALERRGYWPFDRVIAPDGRIQVKFIPREASNPDWNGPYVYGVVKVVERFGSVVCDADRRVVKAIEDSIREMHGGPSRSNVPPSAGHEERPGQDSDRSAGGGPPDAEHHGDNCRDPDVSETD